MRPTLPTSTSLVIALTCACAAVSSTPRVVFDARSPYERVLVIDEGDKRYLRFGDVDGDNQSAIDLKHPERVEVDYVRQALLGLAAAPRHERALVIGVGGGSFITALRRLAPAMDIDAVDIDPLVVEVAQRYFGLRDDEHVELIVEDGASYVARGGPVYDLVLLDAYGAEGVPEALATPGFFAAVRQRVAPGGVVVANISVSAEEEARLVAAMRATFGELRCVFTLDRMNLIVLAGAAPDQRALAARAQDLGVPEAEAARRLGACP